MILRRGTCLFSISSSSKSAIIPAGVRSRVVEDLVGATAESWSNRSIPKLSRSWIHFKADLTLPGSFRLRSAILNVNVFGERVNSEGMCRKRVGVSLQSGNKTVKL